MCKGNWATLTTLRNRSGASLGRAMSYALGVERTMSVAGRQDIIVSVISFDVLTCGIASIWQAQGMPCGGHICVGSMSS